MNPWVCTLTDHQKRRIGKTLEELGELTAVCARLQIQGIDEIDPSSGKTNRQRFYEETADVIAQLKCNAESFDIPADAIERRVREKQASMAKWEAYFP